MTKNLLLLIALLLALATPGRAQLITGFGSAELNPVNPATDFTLPWTANEATLNPTNLTVNAIQDDSGGMGELFVTPIVLKDKSDSDLKLVLTGELTAAPPSGGFDITLYDDSLVRTLDFSFLWSSFSQTGVTSVVSVNPTEAADINGVFFDGNLQAWSLTVGGGNNEKVSFQFDSLTAVPEPSTYALFGIGALALWVLRRRKVIAS